jgi:hypothetical protein
MSGLMKYQYTHQGGSHGPYACPHGISGAQWQGLRGFHQQQHAGHQGHQESAIPQIHSSAG